MKEGRIKCNGDERGLVHESRNVDTAEGIQVVHLTQILLRLAMETTRLSSRGQVVIPKRVREAHSWETGQEFEVVNTGEGIMLRPKAPFPDTTFEEVVGSAGYDGPRLPTEQLTGAQALRKKLEETKK